uniref:F-box domain-containing protein n=1 Tax=Arundo donax TaxID=35708 RepID=A0A0A8YYK3_ARUDO
MPSSSSSPPRSRRRVEAPPPPTPPTPDEEDAGERDWADLPRDAVATVLGKLEMGDVLAGAGLVCRSWRRAAAEEPALWRRVEARSGAGIAKAMLAVWKSSGRCEEFVAERVGDDRILFYLVDRLSCLKSLCLISCYSLSNEGFIEAVKSFPLLEKLELSLCRNIFGEAIEAAGKACPHLKHFRLSNERFYGFEDEYNNDQEARGISTMHELRSLQLFANSLTNRGLAAILDSCPHLESLDIRHCFNVNMNAVLQFQCARIETLRLPDDIIDDYEFEVKSPIRYNSNYNIYIEDGDYWSDDYDPYEDEDVLDDCDVYQTEEDVDEFDGEPFAGMEEPREIPEDEEAMMLDYYASIYEQAELDKHKPDEDGGMIYGEAAPIESTERC